jgi:serine/threonine-protein kinase
MPLTTGKTLKNRYRIVKLLAEGGMGAVYRAWDLRLNAPVALKEMVPPDRTNPQALAQYRQQFEKEAQVLAQLDHPYLVDVKNFFDERGNTYLVMNFVEGDSLADRIEEEGAQSEKNVLLWAQQLLDALAYCHTRGIFHRDIKPENVIIRSDGHVVLADFGLVKIWDPDNPHTKTAIRGYGTPPYAPPEQYNQHPGHTDHLSDIYSLGATLYHALAGRAPAEATARMAEPDQFNTIRKLNRQVSAKTEDVVLKAMELSRDQRWQKAEAMAQALEKETDRTYRWLWVAGSLTTIIIATALGLHYLPLKLPDVTPMSSLADPTASTATDPPSSTLPSSTLKAQGVFFTASQSGKREIYGFNQAREIIPITHTPKDSESWGPVLTSSHNILFTSNRDGKREIYILKDDGNVSRVTHTPGNGESWSPVVTSGGAVLFTSNRDGKREIYTLNHDGNVIRITHTPGDGESWSVAIMAGDVILFTSNRDGKREIYTMNHDGHIVRITHTPGDSESWSPAAMSSGAILFTSNRDGKREIYTLNHKGDATRITHTPGDGESWSPIIIPGDIILFTSNRSGQNATYYLDQSGQVTPVMLRPKKATS